MANSEANQYQPHGFAIAMGLICMEHEKPTCRRLEKRVIDETILLNN